ncbi:MAG: hypothetical protein RSA29_16095 [Clostridium sp.]|uniref:hypothetical protein n=2 Tax=Clostridium sp. TaxID=1506 RepID=UPI003051D2F7
MREAYYPQWYIKKIESSYKKKTKRLIVLFSIFSLVIFMEILGICREIKLVKEAVEISADNSKELSSAQSTIYVYNYICNAFQKNDIEVHSLNISGDDISIEINVRNNDDYRSKINLLEDNFKIIQVSSIIKDDKEEYFKVRMRINEG